MKINYKNEILDLNVTDTGSGEAVLILHGWGTSMDVYQSIIQCLSPYKRVISYDIPGFGNSSAPSFPFSTEDYANLALAVLDDLGINSVTLIGHSHGGRTILNLASRDSIPVSIEKIILIDSAGIVPKRTLSYKVKVKSYKICKKILGSRIISKLFPDALEKFKEKKGSDDYKAVSGTVRDSLVKVVNDDYKERMSKISVPTLLIWGTKDDATPLSDAEFMEKAIENSGLVKIEGAGHYSFLDNPPLTRRVLYSFLNIN